ncbi:GntR family transcriptional regulator [Nonomuraea salmonea]|uniref:GntR family transcriptional regulator n=1 Tax=Nonomuraea salmonea TaxID=46181 RepID=UPI002FE7B3D2
MIEPPLAAMAAEHAAGEELAALRRVLDEAGRHLRGEDAELHDANMAFHRATARLAGNSVLHEVVDSLLTVHGPEQREILQIFDDRRRDYEEHLAILGAIEARDAAQAEERMRAHLVEVKTVIEHRLQSPDEIQGGRLMFRSRVATLGVAALVLAACGGNGAGEQQKKTELTLYNDKGAWSKFFDEMGALSKQRIGLGMKPTGYTDSAQYQAFIKASFRTNVKPDLFTWQTGGCWRRSSSRSRWPTPRPSGRRRSRRATCRRTCCPITRSAASSTACR